MQVEWGNMNITHHDFVNWCRPFFWQECNWHRDVGKWKSEKDEKCSYGKHWGKSWIEYSKCYMKCFKGTFDKHYNVRLEGQFGEAYIEGYKVIRQPILNSIHQIVFSTERINKNIIHLTNLWFIQYSRSNKLTPIALREFDETPFDLSWPQPATQQDVPCFWKDF